jgi:hypothetical protein
MTVKKNRFLYLLFVLALACTLTVHAQTIAERSVEVRFQIDLNVPDAALKAFLPEGWTSNAAAQGAAKDANLRLIFVDRLAVNGPDGKPIGKGSNRLATLVAPVKDPAGNAVQLVIGGISEDPADAPGPFGTYLAASKSQTTRTTSSAAGQPTVDSQDWVFEAKSGEHLEMHIKFEKAVGNRGNNPSETKFYSAKDPTFFQLSRQEQVLDVLRNTTTNPPDRVKEFTLKASGGAYAKLFDGTPKVLSWDNILWISRSVVQP